MQIITHKQMYMLANLKFILKQEFLTNEIVSNQYTYTMYALAT